MSLGLDHPYVSSTVGAREAGWVGGRMRRVQGHPWGRQQCGSCGKGVVMLHIH